MAKLAMPADEGALGEGALVVVLRGERHRLGTCRDHRREATAVITGRPAVKSMISPPGASALTPGTSG
jgi:hypothetical protein